MLSDSMSISARTHLECTMGRELDKAMMKQARKLTKLGSYPDKLIRYLYTY
jgi:hypothetical protein